MTIVQVSIMETTSSDLELEAAEEEQDDTYQFQGKRVLFHFQCSKVIAKLSKHHPLCIKNGPAQSNNW